MLLDMKLMAELLQKLSQKEHAGNLGVDCFGSSKLQRHRSAVDITAIFNHPVVASEYPDYHQIVLHPMDLGTIQAKLRRGEYSTFEACARDVRLVWTNAYLYNPAESVVAEDAHSLSKYFEFLYNKINPSDFNYNREPNAEERQKLSRDIYRVDDSQLAEAIELLEARCPLSVIRDNQEGYVVVKIEILPPPVFWELELYLRKRLASRPELTRKKITTTTRPPPDSLSRLSQGGGVGMRTGGAKGREKKNDLEPKRNRDVNAISDTSEGICSRERKVDSGGSSSGGGGSGGGSHGGGGRRDLGARGTGVSASNGGSQSKSGGSWSSSSSDSSDSSDSSSSGSDSDSDSSSSRSRSSSTSSSSNRSRGGTNHRGGVSSSGTSDRMKVSSSARGSGSGAGAGAGGRGTSSFKPRSSVGVAAGGGNKPIRHGNSGKSSGAAEVKNTASAMGRVGKGGSEAPVRGDLDMRANRTGSAGSSVGVDRYGRKLLESRKGAGGSGGGGGGRLGSGSGAGSGGVMGRARMSGWARSPSSDTAYREGVFHITPIGPDLHLVAKHLHKTSTIADDVLGSRVELKSLKGQEGWDGGMMSLFRITRAR